MPGRYTFSPAIKGDKNMSDQNEVPRIPRPGFIQEQPTSQQEPVGAEKVLITHVENGFLVEIGCKKFIAEEWNAVSKGLELYFKDPKAAKEKYSR